MYYFTPDSAVEIISMYTSYLLATKNSSKQNTKQKHYYQKAEKINADMLQDHFSSDNMQQEHIVHEYNKCFAYDAAVQIKSMKH